MTPAPADRHRDAGFGLLETVISMMLIGVIMTAVISFFVVGNTSQRRQRELVTATQLAADAMDRIQGVKGSALAIGRDYAGSHAAWTSKPAAVAAYLADTVESYDASAPAGAGATATVPTTVTTVTVDRIAYAQRWYLGKCWAPPGGGDCLATSSATAVPMHRVVVLVTWSDRACGSGGCSYVTASLVSNAPAEPVFPVP